MTVGKVCNLSWKIWLAYSFSACRKMFCALQVTGVFSTTQYCSPFKCLIMVALEAEWLRIAAYKMKPLFRTVSTALSLSSGSQFPYFATFNSL